MRGVADPCVGGHLGCGCQQAECCLACPLMLCKYDAPLPARRPTRAKAATRHHVAVETGRAVSEGDSAGDTAPLFDGGAPHTRALQMRARNGGSGTSYRLCGNCGSRIPWENAIYEVRQIVGSDVTTRTLCWYCLRSLGGAK